LGAGVYFVDDTYTGHAITWGLRLGLGLSFDITKKIFIGLETKYFWADCSKTDIDGFAMMLPIGFRL
jgi:hypothetical protein